MKNSNWLYEEHGRNVTSQHGEDGVIEKIFQIIKPIHKICVEFGAMNGIIWSNTYNLIMNHGWRSVQIEMRNDFFKELTKTYKDKPVTCIKETVLPENIEAILTQSGVPQNFDFLSIDVDGLDCKIFEAIKTFKPQVIIIECDTPALLFSITSLAKSKGYELVAVTGVNAFFVLSEFYPLFEIKDNDVKNYKIWNIGNTAFEFGLKLI